MSDFMPDTKPERESAKGPEAYLSPDERKALQRSLSFPEDLPPKFKSWLIDFIAVNIPQIPISQVVGFTQFTATAAPFIGGGGFETTTSGTFTDLSTVGPKLSGLSDGRYLFFFGAFAKTSGTTSKFAGMGIQVNADAVVDVESCYQEGDTASSISVVAARTLSAGGNNIVTAKYRQIGTVTASFDRRFLIALKTGN